MNQDQKNKIKELTEEFFVKMTTPVSKIEVGNSSDGSREVIDLSIHLDEPQILIGQGGQTLFEIQRLLRMLLNKKLQSVFHVNLDINDYKNKKSEYLKDIAKSAADEVALLKQEKALSPMPAYERRIVHAELSLRDDVMTESQGEGQSRHIIIKPR